MSRLALATTLLLVPLLAAPPLAAQAPTLPGSPPRPGVPAATYAPGFFTGPVHAYAFRGCADGAALDAANAPVTLTVFCAAGRVTIGHSDAFGPPGALFGWYDVAIRTHPFLTQDPDAISVETALVNGLLTGGEDTDCPGTCSDVFFPSFPVTRTGQVFTFDPAQIDVTPGARFVPTSTRLGITYPVGTGAAAGTEYAVLLDATFAPIPEPSTWALLGTGLVTLGTWARRRRTSPPT